jgi:DNA sulfur modification protein DndD
MKNFRQFRSVQQIEFASETGTDSKNVTVIFGENGRGKTSIFRAIMFCLYGEKRLSQDEEVEQKELHLVNLAELQESEGKPVETYVELEFQHKEEQYKIKRNLLGMFDGKKRIEQTDQVLLSCIKIDGNAQNIKDPDEIATIINAILDKNVREYFLFDGEKIQRLTLANIEQRREIAKGIRNLLNIDSLEKAIKATQRLKKNLNDELSKKSTGEFGKTIKQLNDLDENRIKIKSQLEQLEYELSHAAIEKKRVDKELDKFKEIRHLLIDRADAENNLDQLEEQGRNLLLEMKTKTGKASLLLVSNTVDYVFTAIDQKKKKGEIPSEMRKGLIEKMLSEKKCICKRDLLPGTEPFNEIVLWKNKTCNEELESSALDMWRYLSTIRSHREDIAVSIETLLQKHAICRNEIDKCRAKIDSLNNMIGSSERKDATKLEKHRENIEKKQINIEAERVKLKDEIDIIEAEYERLSSQRKILEQEEHIKNELSQRASLAEDTYNALQSVFNEFTDEIKLEIATEASKYFSQLLDKEGREILKNILVNNDYSLQIIDRWGKPFLANISAGQRQLMSISFIAALAKVAVAGTVLEMPLFMDTPFGRLSLEHRKNLLEKVPYYCAQWILLATDTEFRKQEASLLSNGGRWGKFYQLQSKGPGITKIRQRDILDVQSILADNSEGLQ